MARVTFKDAESAAKLLTATMRDRGLLDDGVVFRVDAAYGGYRLVVTGGRYGTGESDVSPRRGTAAEVYYQAHATVNALWAAGPR